MDMDYDQLKFILALIRHKFGVGYSEGAEVTFKNIFNLIEILI